MMHAARIPDRLVDRNVKCFTKWKAALHAEDIVEHGKIINRPTCVVLYAI